MTDGPFGSFFLTDPGYFPRQVAGEPWGEREIGLDLPGGPYTVAGLSAAQAELMAREYAAAVAAPAARTGADVHRTEVLRADPRLFRDFELAGWTYTLDLDSSPARMRLASMLLAALVPWEAGTPAGLWTSAEGPWFQSVIENYLRVVVAHRLLLRDGLLLHSAGIVVEGAAYLFVGASGAGKSTLARKALEAGAAVLSDDLNAVTELSSSPAAAQLPFTGELRDQAVVSGRVPLKALLVLEKGPAVECRPLARGRATAAVVATAPFVSRGGHNIDALVAGADALAARVPAARITSARASSFQEIAAAVGQLGM